MARSTAMLCAVVILGVAPAARAERGVDPPAVVVHAELDPFPFATGRYGGQLGLRPDALGGLRLAVASFSIVVPDVIGQLGGNEGFHVDVRPSGALYALYYFARPGADGFAVGGSVRYLRFRYSHDAVPGDHVNVSEISPEAIVGYQWHPFHDGFYLQPWLALGVAVWHRGSPTVGGQTYDELPVSPFFTVNVGWERGL
jgi:hypothetical protein